MNLLVDTHILLWWLGDSPRLPALARSTLGDTESVVFVSAASVWELAIKHAQGKLRMPPDLLDQIVENHWLHLPISFHHAMAAGELPRHHGDPFDRMLIAQALIEGLTIVTQDSRILAYDVSTLTA